MRITGQIGLGREEPNYCSTPVFSTSLIEWAKDRFDGREVSGVVWIDVESGKDGVDELITRIRSDSEDLPRCWWQLHYSKSDINNARLLSVASDTHIADLAYDRAADTVRVKGNAKLKSPRSIGQIFAFPLALAVNSETKELLANSTLNGVGFAPVHVVNRRPEHKSIWIIEPRVILPASPIPLNNASGAAPFDGEFSTGCQYCQPYPNIELSYYATSLDGVDPFDVAATHELIGGVGAMFRHVIVSQHFRKWMNDAKIRGLRYTPVRLLKTGDPVVRNPFDELLASTAKTVPRKSTEAEPGGGGNSASLRASP